MTEYEVKLVSVGYADVIARLSNAGAVQKKPMHLLKIVAFLLPVGSEVKGGWIRVREEGKKITMGLKIIGGEKISDQKEYSFSANSTEDAITFLETLGARQKSYQEKRREIWTLDACEVVIDECPFLDAYIEIEGPDEAAVKHVVEKLGYDYANARVCSVSTLYREKYQVDEDTINNKTPKLIFEMDNPFLSYGKR